MRVEDTLAEPFFDPESLYNVHEIGLEYIPNGFTDMPFWGMFIEFSIIAAEFRSLIEYKLVVQGVWIPSGCPTIVMVGGFMIMYIHSW